MSDSYACAHAFVYWWARHRSLVSVSKAFWLFGTYACWNLCLLVSRGNHLNASSIFYIHACIHTYILVQLWGTNASTWWHFSASSILHIHTYIHIYIHTYIHTSTTLRHKRTYLVPLERLLDLVHTYIHTCIHAYIHTSTTLLHKRTYLVPLQPPRSCTYIHIYIHACIHTY